MANSMKIKSYFARSVAEAMAQASQELGSDAMLMNSRKAPPEAKHLGEYEVVFAAPAKEAGPEPAGAVSAAADSPAGGTRLSREVSELKEELEGMRRALTRSIYVQSPWGGASPDFSEAFAQLAGNEVAPELAREIVEGATARLGNSRTARTASPKAVQQALAEEMAERFQVVPSLGRAGAATRITALVGPPGVGKTTTLVKLAVNYGLACRKPVLLLSVDNYRVAATEQLRSYATILGVGFQVLETVTALAQAIEEHKSKDLILIDTPGFGSADMENAAPLARFLSTRADIDTQLVLSASTRTSDLRRIADGFGEFAAQRMIFTRLDETDAYGQIFSEAVRVGRPLSFFTTGQRIPEDLREATQNELIDLVFHGRRNRWSRAA